MNLIKKISIILVSMTLLSFCFSGSVHAEDSGVGGKLFEPVVDLVVHIGDAIYDVSHKYTVQQNETLIRVDLADGATSIVRIIGTVIVGIVIAAAIAALMVVTAGAIAAVGGAIFSVLAGSSITIGSLSAGAVLVVAGIGGAAGAAYFYNADMWPDTLMIPIYSISPEEIFSNEIPLFDVDFFHPIGEESTEYITTTDENGREVTIAQKKWLSEYTLAGGEKVKIESTAGNLRATISRWYSILRNIAIVALLSILVYIGIRIVISSTSNDKAKYKQMIVDWVIAMCLLFVMQYIMSFANVIVGKVTDLVKVANGKNYTLLEMAYDEKIIDGIAEYQLQNGDGDEKKDTLKKQLEEDIVREVNGEKIITWNTNLIGRARFDAQMAKNQNTTYAGHAVVFLVLVFFTVFFIFTYLKRVIYMAFLTLISPLVALTYPIDKINDGKAQAFDMWIKEYIFNLLIQPLHLLLYYILVTSAFELASKSVMYSILAIGFMIPAEKLMRKFFGFEKAHTPGLLAGPAGAAMAMAGFNRLLGHGPKGGKSDKSSSTSKDDSGVKVKKGFDADAALMNSSKDTPLIDGGNGEGINNSDNYEQSDGSISQQFNDPNSNTGLDSQSGIYLGSNQDANSGTQRSIYLGNNGLGQQQTMQGKPLSDNISGYDNKINGLYVPNNVYEQRKKEQQQRSIKEEPKDKKETTETKEPEKPNEIPKKMYTEDIIKAKWQKSRPGKFVSSARKGVGDFKKKAIKGVKNVVKKGVNSVGRVPVIGYPIKAGKAVANSRAWNAAMSAKRYWARGVANKISNKLSDPNLGKKAIRMAGGVALGATAAGVGMALGVESGDPTKTLQYTTGAGLGGYKFGSGIAGAVPDTVSVGGTGEEFKRVFYGEDKYKDKQIQANIKKAKQDNDMINTLEKKLGSREAAEDAMGNTLETAVTYGIDDPDSIAALYQMEHGLDGEGNVPLEQALAALQLSEKYNKGLNTNFIGDKKRKDLHASLKDRFMNKTNNDEAKSEDFATNTMKLMDRVNALRFKKVP